MNHKFKFIAAISSFFFSAHLFASSFGPGPLSIAAHGPDALAETQSSRLILSVKKSADKFSQQDCNKRKNLLRKAEIADKKARKFTDKASKSRTIAKNNRKKIDNFRRQTKGEFNQRKLEKLEKSILNLSRQSDKAEKNASKHEINASKQGKMASQYRRRASTLCAQ